MPTYGYRCESCQLEFEVWQKMSDEARAACPECGGKGKRLFFPAGIVFKGSGFYKTDSRTSSTLTPGSSPSSAPAPAPKSVPGDSSGSTGTSGTTPASD